MTKRVEAIYEEGILRPLEALPFQEHQRVTVTISDSAQDAAEPFLDHEYIEKVKREVAAMDWIPTLEEVRMGLSKIPGNLSDDFRAEREDE